MLGNRPAWPAVEEALAHVDRPSGASAGGAGWGDQRQTHMDHGSVAANPQVARAHVPRRAGASATTSTCVAGGARTNSTFRTTPGVPTATATTYSRSFWTSCTGTSGRGPLRLRLHLRARRGGGCHGRGDGGGARRRGRAA